MFNRYFLQKTRGHHDFIGVNYYFSATRRWSWRQFRLLNAPYVGDVSDMGWGLNPEGLTEVLMEAGRYNLPVYITENGIADEKDSRRSEFLRAHLRAVEAAQSRGVDVRGYFYWSLLDNFEWTHGFKPRFGLVEVDYETFKRRARTSAYVYRAIIEQAGGQGVGE
jgi:beta-glucosidase